MTVNGEGARVTGNVAGLLTRGEAVCILRSSGLTDSEARQLLKKRARIAAFFDLTCEPMYTPAEVARVAEPYQVAPELSGEADTERDSRLDAERVTLQFGQRSNKRLDTGRRPITESPLFGGEAQGDLW